MNHARPETSAGMNRDGDVLIENPNEVSASAKKDGSPMPNVSFHRLSKMSTKASVIALFP